MNLTKLALKRPVSCALAIVALLVFGLSSLLNFKLQLLPDMEMPMLIVYTMYPGADPESVDELVTSVVEDAGSILSGVDSITSQSFENYSMVLFQYEYGVDIDDCYADLRSALDTASLMLPEDVDTPTVIEMNMNSMPCMMISATEVGDVDLVKVINETVVPEFEKLSGIAEVSATGGSEEYIKVELDEVAMNQYGLTMASIAQFISAVDFTYPAGTVKQGSQDMSVSTTMEYDTAQKLKNVPITTAKGSVITLQDVADVVMSTKAAAGVSRYNNQDNVSITIQNKSSYGTVNACRNVNKALEKLIAENPSIDFQVTYDASQGIIDSLWSVGKTLVAGVVLSMLVLFLFFGDFKASLIVGSSMPISLFLTFMAMNAMGFSLNIVTMGALVIAIGMMVDSSIVVIESCFRTKEEEPSFKRAALEGTKFVTASIVASTITTIVVYLPLAVSKGLSGQMFAQLGYTIVFAMLASLIAAIMLVPLFYSKFKPVEKKEIPMNKLLAKVTSGYKKLLYKVLNKRGLVITLSVAMVVASVLMASSLDMELMGTADEGMVSVNATFRAGTSIEAMDEFMQKWEVIASEEEDVEAYSVSINSASMMSVTGSGSLSAYLKKDRVKTTTELVDEWNKLAAVMPNVDITVSSSGNSMASMMSSGSYEIDLQGVELDEVIEVSEILEEKFAQVDGVVKVANSTTSSSVIARVDVDPLKAMQYGLTPIQVGMTLNNVLSGNTALTITKEGTEYDVILEYPEGSYDNINDLMNLNLQTQRGTLVPLSDIAEVVYEEAQDAIYKQDGRYLVGITSTIESEKYFEAQEAIDAIVEEMEFPETVQPADSAMMDMMWEEFATLGKAILIAVFLVFLVMAMQFESPRFSFMVMMCIPFALIGSFFLLFITQSTISMVSLMGFLMLMGIVVNNGILFIDTANQLRADMPIEDALVTSGVIRLRPILMTSLTTILSMVPMGLGLGTNGEMMQGMALVIIGGMVASTLLTLILIPTVYMIIDKEVRKERRENRKERRLKKKALKA